MNSTCTLKKGVRLYPKGWLGQGQAWVAVPGRRLIPPKVSLLRNARYRKPQPKPTSYMACSHWARSP